MSQNERKPFSYYGSQQNQNYQTPFFSNYKPAENKPPNVFGQGQMGQNATSTNYGANSIFKNSYQTTGSVYPSDNKTTTYQTNNYSTLTTNRYTPTSTGSAYSSFGNTSTTAGYDYTKPSWLSAGDKQGSAAETYKKTTTRDEYMSVMELVDITAMNAYKGKSTDEIRHEDYQLGRKKAGASAPTSTGLFGSTATAPASNLGAFGGTSTSNAPVSSGVGAFGGAQPQTTNTLGMGSVFAPRTTQTTFMQGSRPDSTVQQPIQPVQATATHATQPPPFQQTTIAQPPSFFAPSQPAATSTFTSQPAPPASNAPNVQYTPPRYNFNDPYLIDGLTFEEIQKPTIVIKRDFYKSIFNVKEPEKRPFIKLSKSNNRRPYSIPRYEDVADQKQVPGAQIFFPGKGKIEFRDPIDAYYLREENISKYVFDSKGVSNVCNKRARVTVENFYPPKEENIERFVYELKNDKTRTFIDYNVDDGLYVYECDEV